MLTSAIEYMSFRAQTHLHTHSHTARDATDYYPRTDYHQHE